MTGCPITKDRIINGRPPWPEIENVLRGHDFRPTLCWGVWKTLLKDAENRQSKLLFCHFKNISFEIRGFVRAKTQKKKLRPKKRGLVYCMKMCKTCVSREKDDYSLVTKFVLHSQIEEVISIKVGLSNAYFYFEVREHWYEQKQV